MKILALETSSEVWSLALSWHDTLIYHTVPHAHSYDMLPLIDQCLQKVEGHLEELDLIAYGQGPGHFTGLRFGACLAQSLALGARLMTWGVDSLQALAQQGQGARYVLTCVDARASEVYWALWMKEGATGVYSSCTEITLCAPTDIVLPNNMEGCVGVGNGFALYSYLQEQLALPVVHDQAKPDARDVLTLAQRQTVYGVAPDQVRINYGRRKVALTTEERG